jgi:hypothetical protein
MVRHLLIAVLAAFICTPALAQKPAPAPKAVLGDSAKAMIANDKWEFSNADRDKICTITFKGDAVAVGFKLEFDANCVNLFPLVRDIVGWKYPEDDLLYLLDAQGKALVEFSEVEDGMFEAPTPGLGVLFLQNPAAAVSAPSKKPSDVAGDWLMKRGDGSTICALTLANTPAGDSFALAVKPGCDPAIARLNFGQWRLVENLLVLVPAAGDLWRFEEDDNVWRRLSDTDDQTTLVRQ